MKTLTFDTLRRVVPSAFAEKPYSEVSDRYAYIPTYPLIEALQTNGWQPQHAMESRTRIDEKRGYVKHLIRFVNPDLKLPSVGDTFSALVLTNAHDATAAYNVFTAIYRLVCSNGMVRESKGERDDVIRIRHNAKAVEQLQEAHSRLLLTAKETAREVSDFAAIDLSPDEQGIFTRAALELRWPSQDNGVSTAPIRADHLLTTRRIEDRQIQNNLWGTVNIVQENLVKGGLRGFNQAGGRTTTREIKSVDGDVKLNRALWRLAQEMQALKAGVAA